MKFKGRFVGVSRDILSQKVRITFEADDADLSQVEKIKDIEIQVTAEKFKRKRSLDANAYFHVLVGKIADVMKISKPRCKNILLGRYGQRELVDDKPLVLSILSNVDMMEREDIHTIPVGYAYLQGKEFTHYSVIRGSRTYDTREMSILIDGAVSEARELGIETMTPRELSEMMKAWEAKNNRFSNNKEN